MSRSLIFLILISSVGSSQINEQIALAILNGRGPSVLEYLEGTVHAGHVLSYFPMCETTCTSAELPCARVSALSNGPACQSASIFYDVLTSDPKPIHYCPNGYVCCGANCRPETIKQCSYEWNTMNEQFDQAIPASIQQYLEDVSDNAPSLEFDEAAPALATVNRCFNGCNGWDIVEQHNITTESCSSLCTCKDYAQPEIVPDDVYVCTRQVGPGQTLFSSGITAGHNALTCPPNYTCQDASKCATPIVAPVDQSESTATTTDSHATAVQQHDNSQANTDDSSGISVGALIGIIVGVLVLLGGILAVVLIKRRRNQNLDNSAYKAM